MNLYLFVRQAVRLLGVLLLVGLVGCDTYPQDDFVSEYVVESYLIAGEPLPEVRLSETASVNANYDFASYAVSGATVFVSLLNETGAIEKTYLYRAQSRGVYAPVDQSEVVFASRRYALRIDIPGQAEPIQAATIVPGDFAIEPLENDTLTYRGDDVLTLAVSRSAYPGRLAIYMNKLHAQDTTYALTPFFQGLLDEEEVSREDLIENSSGITNEANFEVRPDGNLSVIVPWIGVAFFGPNDIVIDAIDDNLHDFVRSREDNGTRALGELDNVIDHIDGGRGIFGSLARAKVKIYVR